MDASYLDLVMAQREEISEPEGGGGIWVVADVSNGAIASVTLEMLGAARTVADSLGAYVYGVLLGKGVTNLAEGLYQAGADGTRVADHPSLACFALEPYLEVLTSLFEEQQPEVVLFGATDRGQGLAPRLAQRMGGGLIEHVTAVSLDETTRAVQATFPIYGGEYFEIAACRSVENGKRSGCPDARPQFLTIEPGAFPAPFIDAYRQGEPTMIEVETVEPAVRLVGPAEGFAPPPTPLSQAPVVVAVGRQMEDFGSVERLAAALGGRVAGDRGAWDAGWVSSEQVVDVRGVTVAPDVYVAVGIRGHTFHNAAIEEAKFIVAIHPDPHAPIFQVADLCLEVDPAEILPPLLQALEA